MPKFSADVPRASELSVPLYEVVKRQITEAIMMGKWPAGTVLPSEIALSQKFGVAVGTIRRALQDLTNEGLLSRRRKTGTVVTGRTPQHSLRFFFQYFRLHGLDGSLQNSTSDILSLKRRAANEEERAGLRLDDAAEVISIHRLRSVGGKPVMHEVMALSASMLPEFPDKKEEILPSLSLPSRSLWDSHFRRQRADCRRYGDGGGLPAVAVEHAQRRADDRRSGL